MRPQRRLLATIALAAIGAGLLAPSSPAAAMTITEFVAGLAAGCQPAYIVAGPDGALWFTEFKARQIGRITTAGEVTEYIAGITPGSSLQGIAAGPDGALWFAEYTGRIGRITTAGAITEFSAGITPSSSIMGIAAGPDGALWFTENHANRIGRITTEGVVTEFSTGLSEGAGVYNIAAGPDGAMWFTEASGDRIGRITTDGEITEYSTGITPGAAPLGIVAGPDGAVWFTEYDLGRIGRIATDGVVTEFTAGISPGARPHEIVVGPDGALWFAETGANRVGRITLVGVVTEYATGITPGAQLYGMAVDPDGAIWFTEFAGNRIGRITGPWPQSVRWVPVVIHKDVPSKSSNWRTDVAVLNRSGDPTQVTVTMHPPGGTPSKTLQLGANAQVILTDVAGWLGVTSDSGALEVASDRDIFVSGRTYNQLDATHTYGQNCEGLLTPELLDAGESAWLPQLTESARFRTNIGITNTGESAANVTLTLFDAGGAEVWSNARNYAPGQVYQYQQPYAPLGGVLGGYARVTVNSGSGVVAYASLIDQATGDPATIAMQR